MHQERGCPQWFWGDAILTGLAPDAAAPGLTAGGGPLLAGLAEGRRAGRAGLDAGSLEHRAGLRLGLAGGLEPRREVGRVGLERARLRRAGLERVGAGLPGKALDCVEGHRVTGMRGPELGTAGEVERGMELVAARVTRERREVLASPSRSATSRPLIRIALA